MLGLCEFHQSTRTLGIESEMIMNNLQQDGSFRSRVMVVRFRYL